MISYIFTVKRCKRIYHSSFNKSKIWPGQKAYFGEVLSWNGSGIIRDDIIISSAEYLILKLQGKILLTYD